MSSQIATICQQCKTKFRGGGMLCGTCLYKNNPLKACWWCVHFYFDSGSPTYSDLTPGSDFKMECNKKHWKFDMDSQEHFGECLSTAQTCKDFKSTQEEKK